MRIDRAAARAAIAAQVAEPLGLSVEQAALGIHAVVNETMANASRVQAVEGGQDPATYAMVAFGGAGPVHGWGVARRLRIKTLLVPPSAGLGSALGLLLAPRAFRVARTRIGDISGFDAESIEAIFADMTREADIALASAEVQPDLVRRVRSADLRYRGQRKELTVELPASFRGSHPAELLRTVFEEAYRRVYHRIHEGHAIEALSWRLAAEGPPIWSLPEAAEDEKGALPKLGRSRPMLFDGWAEPRPCAVHARADLRPGIVYEGPLVVEEAESTTLVGPDSTLTIDRFDNLVVSLESGRDRS
jgi:N-methylhydantoinase A/oxoprolinase/acetone carboxylase beta subunit